ncbi:MAG: glycosyltransferase [Panacagrimonas sp.]
MVSHGHMASVRRLLDDFQTHLNPHRFELLLTLNLDEPVGDLARHWPGHVAVIRNAEPRGFGSNHNAAFRHARGRFFAAIDPDLRLHGNPFTTLQESLGIPSLGIASTRVLDEHGLCADNARPLPTPSRVLGRRLRTEPALYNHDLTVALDVDWIAGLFMAMRADTFCRLGGFDERYFLYCEDVDLCLRCWNAGLAVRVVPAAAVTHRAQRRTLKKMQHFIWHCRSLIRLWSASSYRGFVRR